MRIEATVNDEVVTIELEPSESLLHVLRERLGLTGTKRSCEVQVCGACTVLVDGDPVSSCCYLAADIDGREVLTIEGMRGGRDFASFEHAFVARGAVQCGFCIPGMLLTLKSLIDAGELTDDESALREALSGNICRCTGYRAILDAAGDVVREARG